MIKNKFAKVWAFVIGKGGSAKTTNALNLAVLLASMNNKVLLIDNDEQANASLILSGGIKNLAEKQPTICDLYENPKMDIKGTIFPAIHSKTKEQIPNLFYIGSDRHFEHVKAASLSKIHRESILSNHLKKIKDEFDYIFIDCPGDQSIATQNAIVAADVYLIPIKAGRFEMEGISIIYNLVYELLGEEDFEKIKIFKCDYDLKYKEINNAVDKELTNNELVKGNVLKSGIKTDAKIMTAQIHNLAVFSLYKKFPSRLDHINLIHELIKGTI